MDRPGRAAALAWLGHPVTVLALVALVVNDHVLKDRHPGTVTGKLSDVAGLVLAPAVLAAVVALLAPGVPARRGALGSVLATGAGFTLVKAVPAGAALASTVWSVLAGPSLVRADVTDLATLPALGLSLWLASRTRHQRPRTNSNARFTVLVVLPAALVAITATSANRHPEAITVFPWRSMVIAGESEYDGDVEPDLWRASADGGRTWRKLTDDEVTTLRSERPPTTPPARSACPPGDTRHCYRVVDGRLAVEESTDGGGSWRLSWEVPDRQRKLLAEEYEDIGDPGRQLVSRAVAVVAIPDGHAVVVANGRDGYAVRDVTGTWQRTGFGTTVRDGGSRLRYPPIPLPEEPVRSAEIPLGLLAAAVVFTAGGWAARRRRPRLRTLVLLTTTVAGAGVASVAGAIGARSAALDGPREFGPAALSGAGAGPALAWAGATVALVAAGTLLMLATRSPAGQRPDPATGHGPEPDTEPRLDPDTGPRPDPAERDRNRRVWIGRARLSVTIIGLAAGGASTLLLLDTADDAGLYLRSTVAGVVLTAMGVALAIPLAVGATRHADRPGPPRRTG